MITHQLSFVSLEIRCGVSGVCQMYTIIFSSADENTWSEHIHQSLGVSSDKQLAQVRGFSVAVPSHQDVQTLLCPQCLSDPPE